MNSTQFCSEYPLTAEEKAALALAFSLASYNSVFSRLLNVECEEEGLEFDRLVMHDPKAYYACMGVANNAPLRDIAAAHDICVRYWRKVVQCYEEFKKGELLNGNV